MTKIGLTGEQARDKILKRIDELGNSTMESLVEDQLNESLLEILNIHDWKDLQRKTELAYSAGSYDEPSLDMPEDCDRIVTLKPQGDVTVMEYVSPQKFSDFKVLYKTPEYPWIYTVLELTRIGTGNCPDQVIAVWPEPSTNQVFELWYIYHIDEITDFSEVPNLPNHIWYLVRKHALAEVLGHLEWDSKVVAAEYGSYEILLNRFKNREKYGDDRQLRIEMDPRITIWKYRRFRGL